MSRGRLGLFRSDDHRSALERARRLGLQTVSLARLPRPVAGFWLRALRRARDSQDTWSIDVACRPAELVVLLDALADARRVSAPLEWFPRLLQATPAQRANWTLIGQGVGIHWPDVDEDISVRSLLAG